MTNGQPGATQETRLVVSWINTDASEKRRLVSLIATFAGAPADRIRVVHACRSCGSDRHGKPHVVIAGRAAPVYVSLSRSGGLTVVAVTDAGPVGVDVEAGPSSTDLVTWVRKESVLKATGHGLMIDPELVGVTPPGEPPALLTWPEPEPIDRHVWMFDLESLNGYEAAATVLSDVRPRLVRASAGPEA